eukprot:282002_1
MINLFSNNKKPSLSSGRIRVSTLTTLIKSAFVRTILQAAWVGAADTMSRVKWNVLPLCIPLLFISHSTAIVVNTPPEAQSTLTISARGSHNLMISTTLQLPLLGTTTDKAGGCVKGINGKSSSDLLHQKRMVLKACPPKRSTVQNSNQIFCHNKTECNVV